MGLWTATARTAIAFLLALGAVRILNKQFVARQTYFDFVLGITLGAMLAHIPNDYKEPFWTVAVPIMVIVFLGVMIGWLALRYESIRHLLQGEPTVLIENGKILEDNMRRLRYNLDQLASQLRESGVFDMAQVEYAVLEPGGHLSVLPKSQNRPLQPSDLKVPTKYEGLVVPLIMDGDIVDKNLRENSLDENWLYDQLHQRGIAHPRQVHFATLNTQGELFFDLFEDKLSYPVDLEGQNPSTPPSPSVP